jgi:hypothetical protein
MMGKRGRLMACSALFACVLVAQPSAAYEGALHQELTFLAAKHLNRCLAGTAIPRVTPLQVRYIARSAVAQASGGWFPSVFRSDYYDRAEQDERTWLWVFDTRLHGRFDEASKQLGTDREMRDQYSDLGRVVGDLQLVTSPAHVVPVNFARWWRLSMSDRFDGYPIDAAAVEAALGEDCSAVTETPAQDVNTVLRDTASATLRAVQRHIDSLPATWQAFWKLADDPRQFGEYGVAGNNFGRRTEFDCAGTRCVLLDNDPLYDAFALARHVDAVKATLRAMVWLQRRQPIENAAR